MSETAHPWPMLASEGIRSAAGRRGDKIAIRQYTGDALMRTIDYRSLVDMMNRVSNAVRHHWGLNRGDHVAIVAANSIDFIALTCGMGAVGMVIAKPNPKLSIAEICAICDDACAKLIFCDAAIAQRVRSAEPLLADRVVDIDNELGPVLREASAQTPELSEFALEDSDFVLPYTSGTTGRPKGVCVTHRSRSLTFFGMGVEYGCFGPDDRFLGLAPMCHGAGFAFNIAPLYFGGSLDLMTRFDPAATLAHIAEQQVTGVFFVPTHFQALFEQDASLLARSRNHALKAIISNAAPLSQPMKERIVAHFGEGLLHECYGSTEAGIVTSMRPQDQLRKVQSVGLPFVNTQIRLLDDDGQPVAPGEVGELFSFSPYTFAGYWQRPKETEQSLKQGWVSAGDLARQDEEGFYYIVGRKKEMIITGGVNVYPREVEIVLDRHPAIAESAVVGIPDPYWGERVVAAIVVASGSEIPDEAGLMAYCERHIGKQKIPKAFAIMAALPRNPMGKVLKSDISKAFAEDDTLLRIGDAL